MTEIILTLLLLFLIVNYSQDEVRNFHKKLQQRQCLGAACKERSSWPINLRLYGKGYYSWGFRSRQDEYYLTLLLQGGGIRIVQGLSRCYDRGRFFDKDDKSERKTAKTPNLGHCWPIEISYNNIDILQGRRGDNFSLLCGLLRKFLEYLYKLNHLENWMKQIDQKSTESVLRVLVANKIDVEDNYSE